MSNQTMSRLGLQNNFHGIFTKLAQLDVYSLAGEDLYGAELADFYNDFVGDFAADIPLFERLLGGPPKRVLDLACGSGRIGIGLARSGYEVDGLELSQDMLDLVEQNLATEPAAIRDRLHFFKGDMSDFSMAHRYDLITIGVTSISLLLSPEQRMSLFRCVAAHLKPGGKFIFDFLDLGEEKWKKHDDFLDVWTKEKDEGLDFAIVGQRFYPEKKLFVFNVYRERVGWDGQTRRAIGTSTKAWLEAKDLIAAMKEAGLRVIESFNQEEATYLVAECASEKDIL